MIYKSKWLDIVLKCISIIDHWLRVAISLSFIAICGSFVDSRCSTELLCTTTRYVSSKCIISVIASNWTTYVARATDALFFIAYDWHKFIIYDRRPHWLSSVVHPYILYRLRWHVAVPPAWPEKLLLMDKRPHGTSAIAMPPSHNSRDRWHSIWLETFLFSRCIQQHEIKLPRPLPLGVKEKVSTCPPSVTLATEILTQSYFKRFNPSKRGVAATFEGGVEGRGVADACRYLFPMSQSTIVAVEQRTDSWRKVAHGRTATMPGARSICIQMRS